VSESCTAKYTLTADGAGAITEPITVTGDVSFTGTASITGTLAPVFKITITTPWSGGAPIPSITNGTVGVNASVSATMSGIGGLSYSKQDLAGPWTFPVPLSVGDIPLVLVLNAGIDTSASAHINGDVGYTATATFGDSLTATSDGTDWQGGSTPTTTPLAPASQSQSPTAAERRSIR
jgi:hypothetical protein